MTAALGDQCLPEMVYGKTYGFPMTTFPINQPVSVCFGSMGGESVPVQMFPWEWVYPEELHPTQWGAPWLQLGF